MSITEEQLTAWAGLAEKATEGPWIEDDCNVFSEPSLRASQQARLNGDEPVHDGLILHIDQMQELSDEDASFIAAARTAVPALIAEVRELQGSVKAFEECEAADEAVDAAADALVRSENDAIIRELLGPCWNHLWGWELERIGSVVDIIRKRLEKAEQEKDDQLHRAEGYLEQLQNSVLWPYDDCPFDAAAVRELLAENNRLRGRVEELEAEGLVQVCPGCHAVAPERCLPGCIDAEIAAERREDEDLGPVSER